MEQVIKPTDLRINNAVYCKYRHEHYLIKEITEHSVRIEEPVRGYKFWESYETIIPIELSPEILESCGFDLLNGIVGQYELRTDRFLFSFYEGQNDIMIQDMKPVNTLAQGIADLKIDYLHQLQNLFYWLTGGTELSINLEKVRV